MFRLVFNSYEHERFKNHVNITTQTLRTTDFRGKVSNVEVRYVDLEDDCHLVIETEMFVGFNVPSRKGAIGRVVGIRPSRAATWHHLAKEMNIPTAYLQSYIVRFDDVGKELTFSSMQLEWNVDATETKYVFNQVERDKIESQKNSYGQEIMVGDIVVGHKSKRMIIGRVKRLNPQSVRVTGFDLPGNSCRNREETLWLTDFIKIEQELDIESQIAFMALH